MSAINAALDQIDRVAEEGDLTPARHADLVELEALAEPILLPDGKRIYPPRLHGQPIDELACALLDMENPAESTFLRLTGPPGTASTPAVTPPGCARRSPTAPARSRCRSPARRAAPRLGRAPAGTRGDPDSSTCCRRGRRTVLPGRTRSAPASPTARAASSCR
jgi:hypothetical protein